jgi:hypothetical protein
LDWTDEEAQDMAPLLGRRSIASFWASCCGTGMMLGFMLLVAMTPVCDGDHDADKACNTVDKYLSLFSILRCFGFICGLQRVTTNDKIVPRIVNRTFRVDGSRFEIIV